jgi:hypothetical protein
MADDKVRENRLRRMARRQGVTLHKSRRRDPYANDYGVYWLSSSRHANQILSPEFGNLDQVEIWLQLPQPQHGE